MGRQSQHLGRPARQLGRSPRVGHSSSSATPRCRVHNKRRPARTCDQGKRQFQERQPEGGRRRLSPSGRPFECRTRADSRDRAGANGRPWNLYRRRHLSHTPASKQPKALPGSPGGLPHPWWLRPLTGPSRVAVGLHSKCCARSVSSLGLRPTLDDRPPVDVTTPGSPSAAGLTIHLMTSSST